MTEKMDRGLTEEGQRKGVKVRRGSSWGDLETDSEFFALNASAFRIAFASGLWHLCSLTRVPPFHDKDDFSSSSRSSSRALSLPL